MSKKALLFAVMFILISASISSAATNPPSKGQWALALEPVMNLHAKADSNSSYKKMDMPENWISVPSAVRDRNNNLWYSVKINGRSGWLPQNGIRLKMGGKSKSASNIYRNYVSARRKIMNRLGSWTSGSEGRVTVYTTDGAEFRVIRGKNGTEDIYFRTDRYDICSEFLGVDLIDMMQPEVRSKLGTPTMRETPYDEPEITILSFELADRDMTLSITERRYDGEKEGQVILVELYRGRTGERDY